MSRARGLLLGAWVVLLLSPPARADDASPPLRAFLVCEPPPGPGRFRCDAEVRVPDGTIQWAEVLVVRTDDFILPLRGRLGPRDASTHEPDIFRWSLGLVAKGKGTGQVVVRLRAVVCHGQVCAPVESEVATGVTVSGGPSDSH
jgi:hypothetical protein